MGLGLTVWFKGVDVQASGNYIFMQPSSDFGCSAETGLRYLRTAARK